MKETHKNTQITDPETALRDAARFVNDIIARHILPHIRDSLPDGFKSSDVTYEWIPGSDGGMYPSITIRRPSFFFPFSFPVGQFVLDYMQGQDDDALRRSIGDPVARGAAYIEALELYLSWEKAKTVLASRMLSAYNAPAFCVNFPILSTPDGAINTVYFLHVGDRVDGDIPVSYALMEHWGVDTDRLDEAARANNPRFFPPYIIPAAQACRELYKRASTEEKEAARKQGINTGILRTLPDLPCVVSNTQLQYGVAAVTYDGVEDKLREMMGGPFGIFASSVHEALVMPLDACRNPEVVQIVTNASEKTIPPAERLSDTPYILSGGRLVPLK